jgi:Mrp family chromosome partitioning ATPase
MAPADPNYLRAVKSLGRAGNDPRVRFIQNQCLKMSLNLFNRPDRVTRSLGFTSAIPGEGKSFLATLTATTLAERAQRPVTLLDCNWEHSTQHETFQFPETPGLAEWLRAECALADVRRPVSQYLSLIPAGDAGVDSLALTERLRAMGASALLSNPDELLIVDMPSVLTTDYGALLPQALDAVMLVVRAGVTQEGYITEASRELADTPLEGTILNATRTDIPRWLLRLL